MDITVYLPDELGQRAKSEDNINLSRLLRDALIDEFQRRDAMATAEYTEHLLVLEDADGREYTGRIQATVIAENMHTNLTVYLAADGRVIAHSENSLKHWEIDDPQKELADLLTPGEYVVAMEELGMPAVVDL